MLFYLVAGFIVAVDQITKWLIRVYVEIGEKLVWRGIEMTHYENSGMARSMFPGYARLFGVVAVLFVIGVIVYRRRGAMRGVLADCALGFLVGGAAGNAIDRLLFGQVTDFLLTRSGGILNLADHAIEIGVGLMLLYGAVQLYRSKVRPKPRT